MSEYPEYTNGPQQIVFDLDGCLAEDIWPVRHQIGNPIPEAVAMLKHYATAGFSICVHTARPAVDESVIWDWLLSNNIPCDKVRCNKPVGWLYVDDRGYRFERR